MAQNKSVWKEDWMDSASRKSELGESDEECHRLGELYEQLGESDEFSPGYVCVCIRRVARRKFDR